MIMKEMQNVYGALPDGVAGVEQAVGTPPGTRSICADHNSELL
jgi:hypothetical protein